MTKDKRVTFEQDEVKTIKRFGTAGMKLIGFKPISSLKPHYYVKPGHFLYPVTVYPTFVSSFFLLLNIF